MFVSLLIHQPGTRRLIWAGRTARDPEHVEDPEMQYKYFHLKLSYDTLECCDGILLSNPPTI
jgi:hypothetical protein